MRILATPVLCALLPAMAPLANADTLRLKNGSAIEGTLLGADTRQVQFVGRDRQVLAISISSIAAIEFGDSAPVAPPRAPAPPPRAAPGLTIPAGMAITVRMIDSIDSKTTGPGERFRCSVDDPIVVNNQVYVSRNADCTVQITSVEGGKELGLKLYDITVNGRAYDTVSNYAQLQAQGAGKGTKAARRGALLAGVGAGIGALAGGGRGAAIGAASGAGLGAISGAAAKGKHLQVPSETRLSFELRAPLPLN